MKNSLDLPQTAEILRKADNVLILPHRRPDGDAVGSAFGLYFLLQSLGKRTRIECADPFPEKYSYFTSHYAPDQFEPATVISVDTATTDLLGALAPLYEDKIDLAIDHHATNSFYAKNVLLDSKAAATTEIIFLLAQELQACDSAPMLDALYTGLVADTGCFRYQNVTSRSLKVGACLVAGGANHAKINHLLFETKSQGVLQAEKQALDSLQYFLDGQCAMITLGIDIAQSLGIAEDDLSGVSTIPRSIEGVLVGITLRAQAEELYRVSVRTNTPADASRIAGKFGGGGHSNAAGCTIAGKEQDVKTKLIAVIEQEVRGE